RRRAGAGDRRAGRRGRHEGRPDDRRGADSRTCRIEELSDPLLGDGASGRMSVNGRAAASHDGQALAWPGRVLSLADLRHSLNGHREVTVGPDTVVTPLAVEEL